MMKHIAVVAWTSDNRIAKYQDYETANDAAAHVDRFVQSHAGAFVAQNPGIPCDDWRVDPGKKTLTLDPRPRRSPRPDDVQVLVHALKAKGVVITPADLKTARDQLMNS